MDPSAQPQFFRARPLAYANREKLEKELVVVVVNLCFTSLFGTKGLLSDIVIR